MNFHSAYILHRYPYQEKSYLLKVFTADEGLVTLVARNAKRPKSDWYGILQPFQKLKLAYQGKGNVLTLNLAERDGPSLFLQNEKLWAGFYLNELLLKFLAPHDVHAILFDVYRCTVQGLSGPCENLEKILRKFELTFFEEMGLLPDFKTDQAGDNIESTAWYQLERHHLPKKINQATVNLTQHFQGIELLALREHNFENPLHLRAAKRFTRLWLEFHGAGGTIQSREIFASLLKI